MNTRLSLDVINVKTPCTADWDTMQGDDRTRFCGHCQKHVHNLSAMPSDEAERLVCQSAGRLCVRFARDAAGQVLTLDYRATTRRRWTWKVWTLIALAGALITGTVEAVFFGRKIAPPGPTVVMGSPPPMMLMGDVAVPPPPNPPPPAANQ